MNGSSGDDNGAVMTSFMVKRSLMKSRIFQSDNYKSRWFKVFATELKYYEGTLEKGPTREKGCINLENIRVVEEADLDQVDRKHGFQVWYDDPRQTNTSTLKLYISAQTASMKEEWIATLRQLCEGLRVTFAHKYHPGVWTPKTSKFTCCQQEDRDSPACTRTYCADLPHVVVDAAEETTPRYRTTRPSPTLNRGRKSPKPERKLMSPKSERRGQRSRDASPAPSYTPFPFPPARRTEGSAATNLPQPLIDLSLPSCPLPEIVDKRKVVKVVMALYDYKKANPEDLEISKGERLEIIDDHTEEYWWKARNSSGESGFIPANYVMEVSRVQTVEDNPWFFKDLTRQRAELVLKNDGREGCFLVRKAQQNESYTVGIYTKDGSPDGTVRHYHVKKVRDGPKAGLVYLHPTHPQSSIEELVAYHKQNSAGLANRLRNYPGEQLESPATVGLRHGTSIIDAKDLKLLSQLGKGNFGCVMKALYKDHTYVAVKMTQEGMMADQDFVDEAKTMMQLQHANLVQLYGVCEKPLYIVTEYMEQGALLDYLKNKRTLLLRKTGLLLDMCLQVAKGMEHLEKNGYIHRDLAARNCLVSKSNVVKVADFGLSRHVVDDEYTAAMGAKFPIRWASPEVLNYTKFSSKSDIWAYGVLMWEIFTGGEMPYSKLRNPDVIVFINQKRSRLQKPSQCPSEVYNDVMMSCWAQTDTQRPNFTEVIDSLQNLVETMGYPE